MDEIWYSNNDNKFTGRTGLFKDCDGDYWLGINLDSPDEDQRIFKVFSKEEMKSLYESLKLEFEK
jgi:hypothetical protein